MPVDADGRGTDEAKLARLVFGLDLEDLHLTGDSFLGHDLA